MRAGRGTCSTPDAARLPAPPDQPNQVTPHHADNRPSQKPPTASRTNRTSRVSSGRPDKHARPVFHDHKHPPRPEQDQPLSRRWIEA